jgi:hypothetical protein
MIIVNASSIIDRLSSKCKNISGLWYASGTIFSLKANLAFFLTLSVASSQMASENKVH